MHAESDDGQMKAEHSIVTMLESTKRKAYMSIISKCPRILHYSLIKGSTYSAEILNDKI